MIRNQTIKKSENEIKKIKEQRLVEVSDKKLSESLFSNNPYTIDKTPNISIVKLDKNKFVSVIKPPIIKEKIITPTIVKTDNKINRCYDLIGYDLNDYNYDFELSDFN